MEVTGQLYAPAVLLTVKEPSDPLQRKLGGLQNPPGHFGEENKFHSCWDSNHNSSDVQFLA